MYDNCSHFCDIFQKTKIPLEHVYIYRNTTDPIHALQITIYITKHTNNTQIDVKHTNVFKLFEKQIKTHFLCFCYYIWKLYNSYFIYLYTYIYIHTYTCRSLYSHLRTFIRHHLQNKSQPAKLQNVGAAAFTPHGVFDHLIAHPSGSRRREPPKKKQ